MRAPRIHARGDVRRLDAVLDLVAYSARPHPLSLALDELPRRMAEVLEAQVCSIYLREGDDLVMRGNVGFDASALGEVRLAEGEGITGLAVKHERPISIDAAPKHSGFHPVPGLGEERFPFFLAVPIMGPEEPLGALVLQRAKGPGFDAAEIELATALTAPIAAMTERARLVSVIQRGDGERRLEMSRARPTLTGRSGFPGRALGVVGILPRQSAADGHAGHGAHHPGHPHGGGGFAAEPGVQPRSPEQGKKALRGAALQARKVLASLFRRARGRGEAAPRWLVSAVTMLEDTRLQERALELAGAKGLAFGLGRVATEALKVARRTGDPFALDRARQLSDVCETLALLSSGQRLELPSRAVWIGEHLGLSDVVLLARVNPVALVLAEGGDEQATREAIGLLAIPTLVEVTDVFRWAHSGEFAVVDANHGLLRLNPSRAEIDEIRASER